MLTSFNGKGRWTSALRSGLAIAAAVMLVSADALAKAGKGGNSGSRGTHSQSAPPPTQTAPRQAQPLPGQPGAASQAARQPATAAQPSRFGTGLMGGLMGGLLGAGLIGMLMGGGFLSGLGSFMGFLGLLLQVALLAGIVMLGLAWWRSRKAQPALAGGEPMARQPIQPDWQPTGSAQPAMQAAPVQEQPIQVTGDDFSFFQQRLGEIQEAYGRGDRIALARMVTPEMANRFSGELDHDARQGAVNRISNVTLLQGDLSEAWAEPGAEYATVAMRYSLIDVTLDKASGKVLDGDPAKLQESTELWTFVREPGAKADGWLLSAIQQA